MGHGQKYGQRNNREAAHLGVRGQRLNAHFQGNGQLTRKKIDPYPAGIRETGLQISAENRAPHPLGLLQGGPGHSRAETLSRG